eukprot:maker-scaffold1004_size71882-snap-gene-0.11 protein:Tk10981 transcript:maker-scaffold1004_size71882-snap-gene-0.11-mRNA-1 annotation:"hypothetical membrane protein"
MDPFQYYQYPVARRDFNDNPVGAIVILAAVAAVGGGLAIAQASTERTNIQNSINSLNTDVNALSTSIVTSTSTLNAQTTQTSKNTANLNLICASAAKIGAITEPTDDLTTATALNDFKVAAKISYSMRILLSCVGLAILQGTWAVEEDCLGDEYVEEPTGLSYEPYQASDYQASPSIPQQYYPNEKKKLFGDSQIVPILAVGVGAVGVGLALVKHSALAREQIRSQVTSDQRLTAAINTLLPTQTAAITSLTTSQALVTTQVTQLCAALAAAEAAIPAPIAAADQAPIAQNVETVICAGHFRPFSLLGFASCDPYPKAAGW